VVLASEGYPDSYPTGRQIDGLDQPPSDGLVFQAGSTRQPETGRVVTSGGRVLTAVGLGADLSTARQAAYELAEAISFEGCYYRRDIAASLVTQHPSLITSK
jgi:phosphoribosylamine--glycine ligase